MDGRPGRPPSILRMRAICQAEKLRRPDDLTRRHRFVSIYATWALVHTGITADQVTIASIALGLAGALALAMPGVAMGLLGVFLLYVSFLADQVDGEVARYRRATSLRGVYLDELRHLLIYAVPVFALGFDVARSTGETWQIALAFIAALVLVLSRIEERLPLAVFGARARDLLSRAVARELDATPAPVAPAPVAPAPATAPHAELSGVLSLEEREVLRSIVTAAERVYGFVAHQVVILFLLAFAVLVDRIGEFRPLGLGLEGALLLAIAASGAASLAIAVVSRARGDAFERETLTVARKALGAS